MNGNLATIVKDGDLINIDEDELSEGDIVALQTGDIVPADLKLVEVNGLEIDEFEITGEIMPVIKRLDGDNDVITYMGSRIFRGAGKGVVIATGEQTEYGKVTKQRWEQNQPYQFRFIENKYLILIGLLLPPFIFQVMQSDSVIGATISYVLLAIILLLVQNDGFFKHLLISNEIKKLGRLDIQIRDTGALDQLNKVDIFCFDKTGVLTTRHMDMKNLHFIDGAFNADSVARINENTFHWIKTVCALCHDVWLFEKLDQASPIDKALISFAMKSGVDAREWLQRYKRIYDKPFDSETRYMACGFEINGDECYFAKGDPEVILRMCNRYMTATGAQKRAGAGFWYSNRLNLESISQNGNTVIALAYSDISSTDYTFLCLVELENPLQAGARETIKGIAENGIRSILLTGDRAETAVRVAEDCGIAKDSRACLTGRTIEKMETSEIIRQSAYCSIFARLLPSQKGFLIRLLQQNGHCIAMVGDGVNDGIALKVADVGISFVKNSSPIARRLAKILINELADLLRLMESANRIEMRGRPLNTFRILLMAVCLLGVYMWAFIPHSIGR